MGKPGGAEGNRTPDLCSAIAALSHLSYGPLRLAHLGGGPSHCQGRRASGRAWRLAAAGAGRPCPRRCGVSSSTTCDLGGNRYTHEEATRCSPILYFIDQYLIDLFIWIIIASAIMSWLIAFNVVNPYNQFVRSLWDLLNALTEPLLRPIRRLLPDLGGIDISPVVLILILRVHAACRASAAG